MTRTELDYAAKLVASALRTEKGQWHKCALDEEHHGKDGELVPLGTCCDFCEADIKIGVSMFRKAVRERFPRKRMSTAQREAAITQHDIDHMSMSDD